MKKHAFHSPFAKKRGQQGRKERFFHPWLTKQKRRGALSFWEEAGRRGGIPASQVCGGEAEVEKHPIVILEEGAIRAGKAAVTHFLGKKGGKRTHGKESAAPTCLPYKKGGLPALRGGKTQARLFGKTHFWERNPLIPQLEGGEAGKKRPEKPILYLKGGEEKYIEGSILFSK